VTLPGARTGATSPDAPSLSRVSRPRSAHDIVAHGIGRGILEGEFAVGSTLPGDAELMDRFGVSRTALREAMKTLAAKGLIESKARVGTRVLGEKRWNMFDPEILAWRLQLGVHRTFLASLFEIRQALEPLAAAAAASYRSEADLEAIAGAWADMGRQPATRDSFTAADLAFHRAILDASANPFLRSIGSVIEAALATSFTISSPVDDPEQLALSSRQHRRVLDAIAAGNPQAASDAMTAVILQGAESAKIDHAGAPGVDVTIKLLAHAATLGSERPGFPARPV
jgi:DNA-binding FadR family transcriptional regulator